MTDRYESRATTHADGCWEWGPAHNECAVREIEILRAEVVKLRNLRADAALSDAERSVPEGRGEQKANTLLVAAPELLVALKKVAQSLEWFAHGRCRGFDDETPLPTNEAVELAERTLAKMRA